jgi:hypothetical protein
MGNCAGMFQACKGDDNPAGASENAVKKIDKDQISQAINELNQEDGDFGNGGYNVV